MTKEEKIRKILDEHRRVICSNDFVAKQIVATLEEPKERFLQNEVVAFWGAFFFKLYRDIRPHTDKELLKLRPEVLAATVGARILGARWAAVDENEAMYFYKDEPTKPLADNRWYGPKCADNFHNPYRICCPVDDWTRAKWML